MSEAWGKSAEQEERERARPIADELLQEIVHRAEGLNDKTLERAVYVWLDECLEMLIAQIEHGAAREGFIEGEKGGG